MRTFKYLLLVAALFVVALYSPARSASISGQFQDFAYCKKISHRR